MARKQVLHVVGPLCCAEATALTIRQVATTVTHVAESVKFFGGLGFLGGPHETPSCRSNRTVCPVLGIERSWRDVYLL
jgi:hypothetical protein